MALRAEAVANNEIGFFRVFAKIPGRSRTEVTMFRGVPCQVTGLESQDPFGDSMASISFPQITVFDRPGSGDLWWLVPYADIDIEWYNAEGYHYRWSWEGFIVSENASFGTDAGGLQIECKGALFQADNFLAAPWFPKRPVPYELLIYQSLNPQQHRGLRTGKLRIEWPQGWDTRVPDFKRASYLSFLKPWGVKEGDRWTGLTSRSTGSWDPILTGFVQGLLSVMYDDGGAQWTVMKDRGRKPVMRLRQQAHYTDDELIRIPVGDPGIEISMSRDFTQSANVIYGQGSDTAGITFSGMNITNDGNRTYYEPFAYSPYTHPADEANPNRNGAVVRKEAFIRFPDGLDEISSQRVAQAQLQRFADPGITGTITLSTDPHLMSGDIMPRFLVKAGQSALIEGVRGITEGVLVHISKVDIDINQGSCQLTFDSKYRDQLTVQEVRARTLDSLTPLRSLQVGKFSNTVQDLLKPWSYADGSGIIPGGKGRNAKEFFLNVLPANAQFPWEPWTRRHPPKDPKSAKYYIKIPPARLDDSRMNWAGWTHSGDKKKKGYIRRYAYPFKAAQNGTIRLVQIAAYDKHGNVKPVRFHVSFYTGGMREGGITQSDMPKIPNEAKGDPKARILGPQGHTYRQQVNQGIGQPNPFFENAWEQYLPSGLKPGSDGQLFVPAQGANLVVGWGNFYEPAGYWPGRKSRGAPKTGMIVDESSWTFDTTADSKINEFEKQTKKENPDAGLLYIMIYCDDQGDEPVYFMGRIWRQEPGT